MGILSMTVNGIFTAITIMMLYHLIFLKTLFAMTKITIKALMTEKMVSAIVQLTMTLLIVIKQKLTLVFTLAKPFHFLL